MVLSREKLTNVFLGIHGKEFTFDKPGEDFQDMEFTDGEDDELPEELGLRREQLAPDTRKYAFPPLSSRLASKNTIIEPLPEEIGISGFDLRVGQYIAWSDILMAKADEEALSKLPHETLYKGEEFILKSNPSGGRVYYIFSFEKLNLPLELTGMIDSKSTTGRVGAMSHGVGMTRDGQFITAIQPYAFPLKITCGKTKLSQAAIRYTGTSFMKNEEISQAIREGRISITSGLEAVANDGIRMRFATERVYEARKCNVPIDMDAKGSVDWDRYFKLIDGNSGITIKPKTLYLFGSLEEIGLKDICGMLTREGEVLTGTGTWGHFAGIIQPFFRGGITFEVYSFSKRRISSGDSAGLVVLDKIDGTIDAPKDYGGAYQGQKAPKLPKMFNQ